MEAYGKALASIGSVEKDYGPNGGFTAVLSTPSKDRDGDILNRHQWITPLPDRLPLDIDHGMSVADTIGSFHPYFQGNTLMMDAYFASTEKAQNVRTLIQEGHINSVSVAFRNDKSTKGETKRELLNAGVVAIPSNRDAVIQCSKSVKEQMNINLKAKGAELEDRLTNFTRDYDNDPNLSEDDKQKAFDQLKAEIAVYERQCEKIEIGKAFLGRAGVDPIVAAGTGSAPKAVLFNGLVDGKNIVHTGGQLAPLAFDAKAMAELTASHEHNRPIRTKAYSGNIETKTLDSSLPTMGTLLPAQLHGQLVDRVWDIRIADLLPAITANSSKYEFLRDNTTSSAQAAVVGEGQTKPKVDISLGEVTFSFAKVAGLIKLSREQMSDFSQALGYSISQLQRNIVSEENQQLLYGDGSTNGDGSVNMVGLANTANILTHTVGTLASGDSHLDSILSAIDGLRTGSALATPSWALVHPTTWHAICMEKDGLNRSLVSPDPTQDSALRVWDVPVHLSTDVAKGDMFLVDNTKMGYIVVREGLIINGPDHDADDFSRNLTSWVAELRENVAVVRPSAVYLLQGLPTSFTTEV